MKITKFVVTLLITAILFCSVTVSAGGIFETPEVISANDFAGVMQPSTVEYIKSRNDVMMNQCKSKIIFAVVPTTGAESIDSYANRLYKAWSVAYIGDSSSVFVLLATEDMQYWTVVGSHIQSALTQDIVNSLLLTYMEPDFAKKDYDAAIRKTYDAFADWYGKTFKNAYNTSTTETDTQADTTKPKSNVLATIWNVIKILLVAAVVLIVLSLYIRRKIRLRQIAHRKRMRRARIEKYRSSEPKEQYSFSYSAMRDDDEF